MAMMLVFENRNGDVMRTMPWDGGDLSLVRNKKSRRVQLISEPEKLRQQGVEFVELLKLKRDAIFEGMAVKVQQFGTLKLVSTVSEVMTDIEMPPPAKRNVYYASLLFLLLGLGFLSFYHLSSYDLPTTQEENAQRLVKIVTAPKVRKAPKTSAVKKPRPKNVRKYGALAALSRIKSPTGTGVQLSAVKSTRGPGVGSNTRLRAQSVAFDQGLVGAAAGGGSVKGLGRYQTRGKGGGQSDYGAVSMAGGLGAAEIPEGDADVGGGLDRSEVFAVIKKNMAQVRFCYEQGLQSQPNIAGRVPVTFVINGRGTVRSALVQNSSLGSDSVENCILRRLRSWRFPEPRGGVDVKVTFPFFLKRLTQG